MRSKKIKYEEFEYDEWIKDLRLIIREEMNKRAPAPDSSLDKLLTIAETADHFQVTQKTIFNWGKNGLLHPIQIGRRVFFEQREIENLIETNKTKKNSI